MTATSPTASTEAAAGPWHIYRGLGEPHAGIDALPPPPPWRNFARTEPAAGSGSEAGSEPGSGPESAFPEPSGPVGLRPAAVARARAYRPDQDVVDTVNAALYLRRPLLVTGKPGTGKSTLAASLAFELGLGPVLAWPVTSRSTLDDALYRYDAIGRLQEANLHRDRPEIPIPDIGRFLRLGPLGTALVPWARPRVLLVDELDKSDIDLPNDLLNVFEEGEFEIPELTRLPEEQSSVVVRTHDGAERAIERGRVRCQEFPVVVITSNGEREFPPAFRRRCLPLYIQPPSADKLRTIVAAQLGQTALAENDRLLEVFLATRETSDVSTDQLLNLVFLAGTGQRPTPELRERLQHLLLHPLGPV